MTIKCLHYNYTINFQDNANHGERIETNNTCRGNTFEECRKEEVCQKGSNHCFLLITPGKNQTGAFVSSAGCYPPITPGENCSSECIGYKKSSRYFCCCTSDLCNKNFRLPSPQIASQSTSWQEIEFNAQTKSEYPSFWIPVIPLVLLATVLTFYIHKHYRDAKVRKNRRNTDQDNYTMNNSHSNDNNNFNKQHTLLTRETTHHDANSSFIGMPEDEVRIDFDSIQLLENIGTGRFGRVHRAQNESDEVAVKVILDADYESWLNEQNVYRSFKTRHENILNFISACKHLPDNNYWLVLEFASRGSLHSYLEENVLSWKDFMKIASGVVRGLSHLHESDIAHRDFKSKNVLLKHDLTPCVTDFGVAIVFDTSSSSHIDHRKKYLQVGTPRYMAPEVLECSVTFTKASFTKIDVYALSLVLWELLNRCHPLPTADRDSPEALDDSGYNHENELQPDSYVTKYQLPFEDLVGHNPDILRMRQVVVVDKLRPPLKEDWRKRYPTSEICRAIEDGWEYDHDARISASCFVERVNGISRSKK